MTRTVDRVRACIHRGTGPDRATRGVAALGVEPSRTYVGHGLTGTNRDRPGCARCSPRAARATPWWSPNLIDWRSLPDPARLPRT